MRLSPLLRSPFSRVALVCISLVWTALALLTACSDSASPEQQVRAVIESMETAAEARDVGDLLEHISANYRDAQGQDRTEASRYARGYFIANQSVHLLTRIESLEFPAPDEARVKLQVGMAGRGSEAGAAGLSTDLYDFNLALIREGDEWKVSYADWDAH
jgi:outer membrane biogenesis lipoprotein LolB